MVVRGRRRRTTSPDMPSRRISRSTVHRATAIPSRRNCAYTLRAPYRFPLAFHTRRISTTIFSSSAARADGCSARFRAA